MTVNEKKKKNMIYIHNVANNTKYTSTYVILTLKTQKQDIKLKNN